MSEEEREGQISAVSSKIFVLLIYLYFCLSFIFLLKATEGLTEEELQKYKDIFSFFDR